MPVRASPRVTRRAMAVHCGGMSGASVATIAITDPAPAGIAKCSAIGLSAGEQLAERQPAQGQFLPGTEVGLEEHADGVAGAGVVHQPGRGAVTALELVAVHAGAAADGALLHRPGGGRLQGGQRRLLGDMVPVDVVEVAVPGLRRHRQQPGVGEVGVVLDRPGDDRGVGDPDRVGVGDGDRPGEAARLRDPGHAGHLPVAVLGEEARRDRVGRACPGRAGGSRLPRCGPSRPRSAWCSRPGPPARR